MITGTQEESNEGIDHFIAKVLTEEEHAKHDTDGNQTKEWHGPFDELEDFAEFLNVAGILINQVAREAIGPESIRSFTESYLQLDLLGLMPVFLEEVEGVFEDLSKISTNVISRAMLNLLESLLEHHRSSSLCHISPCLLRLTLLDLL